MFRVFFPDTHEVEVKLNTVFYIFYFKNVVKLLDRAAYVLNVNKSPKLNIFKKKKKHDM